MPPKRLKCSVSSPDPASLVAAIELAAKLAERRSAKGILRPRPRSLHPNRASLQRALVTCQSDPVAASNALVDWQAAKP
jgi:hypothetical protein